MLQGMVEVLFCTRFWTRICDLGLRFWPCNRRSYSVLFCVMDAGIVICEGSDSGLISLSSWKSSIQGSDSGRGRQLPLARVALVQWLVSSDEYLASLWCNSEVNH